MDAATFAPLEDGLVVTGGAPLRAKAANWRVVVVLHATLEVTTMLREVKTLEGAVASIDPERIPALALLDWTSRLGKLRSALTTPNAERDGPTLGVMNPGKGLWRRRERRGLVPVIGSIASFMFGIAQEQDVQEVRKAIDQTRQQGLTVAHVVSQLTSVVNGSRELIIENRNRLNEVSRLVNRLAAAENNTQFLMKNFYSLHTQQNVDRVIRHVEREYTDYKGRLQQLARQRVALELGSLTEDLLPIATLRDIMRRATKEGIVPVEPTEWYYQYTKIMPLWGNGMDSIVFKVELPLVRPVSYLGYEIHTYEVPYSNSTTTVRLQAEGRYGLDTQSGEMFEPIECLGDKPRVCRAGPLYSSGGLDCARAVISGRDARPGCRVQVANRPDGGPRVLAGDRPNRFILLTWGEILTEHCMGRAERTLDVTRGTYAVTLEGGCVLKTEAWSVRGLLERNSSLQKQDISVPVGPINLRRLLPPERAFTLPKQAHPLFPDLGEVATVNLGASDVSLGSKLDPIQWRNGHRWWLLWLVPIGLLGVAIAGYFLRRRLMATKLTVKKTIREEETKEAARMPTLAWPLLSHRLLRRPAEAMETEGEEATVQEEATIQEETKETTGMPTPARPLLSHRPLRRPAGAMEIEGEPLAQRRRTALNPEPSRYPDHELDEAENRV